MLSILTSKAKKNQPTQHCRSWHQSSKGKEAPAGARISAWCRTWFIQRNTASVSSEPTPAINPACIHAGGHTAFTSGGEKESHQIFLLHIECTVLNRPRWRRMDGLVTTVSAPQCWVVSGFTPAQPNGKWNGVNPCFIKEFGLRSLWKWKRIEIFLSNKQNKKKRM